MEPKVLFSACLLGQKVRYDGGDVLTDHPAIKEWAQKGLLVSICQEVAGGLPVPRPPAEIQQPGGGQAVLTGHARVEDNQGADVSAAFIAGAEATLVLANKHQVQIAVMKEKSPSCGSSYIYDGNFQGNKLEGQGVAAALLKAKGVFLFSELELDQAYAKWKQLRASN